MLDDAHVAKSPRLRAEPSTTADVIGENLAFETRALSISEQRVQIADLRRLEFSYCRDCRVELRTGCVGAGDDAWCRRGVGDELVGVAPSKVTVDDPDGPYTTTISFEVAK